MKKLVAITAILATASMAMAVPSFTLPNEIIIDLNLGNSVVVSVGTDAGSVQGMNLYLGTTAPFELSNLDILADGSVFAGNHAGELIDTAMAPAVLSASVVTNSGSATLGTKAATVTITVPVGTAVGTIGLLSTDLGITDPMNLAGVVSDWGGPPAGQATATIRVIPEPATALLLLAAVPFLRRRHA